MGIRDARTTHPRKALRRQRAAARFSIKADRRNEADYMRAKKQEAAALGVEVA